MTTTLAPVAPVTPEDLLRMPDAVSYELLDGKLVARETGMESSLIGGRIFSRISRFQEDRPLGLLFPADASYQCFRDAPGKVRKPDVSFIRFGRLPGDVVPKGHCRISPDLAVEVVSPGDTAEEVEDKVAEYLGAGVPLVWVAYPTSRKVRVHRPRSSPLGSGSDLTGADLITGEDVLPGFSCAVERFFSDAVTRA